MILFNLEKAIAGAPIQCRDGSPAKFLIYTPQLSEVRRVWVLINNHEYSFTEDGKAFPNNSSSENGYSLDLFMAPEIKELWLNIYEEDQNSVEDQVQGLYGYAWKNKDTADRINAEAQNNRIACIKISYQNGDGL